MNTGINDQKEKGISMNIGSSCEKNVYTSDPVMEDEESSLGIIKIYVYQPFIRIRYIKLNENRQISILNCIYSKNSIYIFRGIILIMTKTFIEYGIHNDNKIVLLPSSMVESNPGFVSKWQRLTSNQMEFEQKIDFNMCKGTHKELARIKDIKYSKLETKKNFLKKCEKSINSKNSKKQIKDENELITDFKRENSPSAKPLPIIW